MSDEESDILCTIVMLKALARTGGGHSIVVPMAARLSPEGWRLAAIQFLDKAKAQRQRQEAFVLSEKPVDRASEGRWQELNERFDFEDARERAA